MQQDKWTDIGDCRVAFATEKLVMKVVMRVLVRIMVGMLVRTVMVRVMLVVKIEVMNVVMMMVGRMINYGFWFMTDEQTDKQTDICECTVAFATENLPLMLCKILHLDCIFTLGETLYAGYIFQASCLL